MVHSKIILVALLALSTFLGCEKPQEFNEETQAVSTPYAPSPVPLPSSIVLPQDVIDDVVVGTVNPQVAQCADAILYARERVDKSFLRVTLDAGSYTNQRLAMSASGLEGAGNGRITIVSNRIHFVDAGTYLVTFQFAAQYNNSGAFFEQPEMRLVRFGPSQPYLTGRGIRPSVSNTEVFWVQASGLVDAAAGTEYDLFPGPGYVADAWTLIGPAAQNTLSVHRVY